MTYHFQSRQVMTVKLKEKETKISLVKKTWWIVSTAAPSCQMETDSLTVFTQSEENGCQNKESLGRKSPQIQLISWEHLISYQLSSGKWEIEPAIGKYMQFCEQGGKFKESQFSLREKFKDFLLKTNLFSEMLIKVKVNMLWCRLEHLFSLF